MSSLSLLGLFAHPDDEQIMSGVLARSAAEGIKTGLICATRGEMGEIADPSIATSETLGSVRENEMRAACAVLGVKYLWFLDYKDSGMAGTPGNDDPACFFRCADDEALSRIVKLIREFKPDVVVTFDPTGGYGHPDHLTMYRLAVEAFRAASDPQRYTEPEAAWQPKRLYYAGFPRSLMRRFSEWIEQSGVNTGLAGLDMEQYGFADEEVTNRVDVKEWVHIKERSLSHHRTQMDPNSFFTKMPDDIREMIRAHEYYVLADGTPLPPGSDGSDLFAGLRD